MLWPGKRARTRSENMDEYDDAREKAASREIGYGDGRDQPFGL